MTREEAIALLRMQRTRGPLPATAEALSAWVAELSRKVPLARLAVPVTAVSPLRALGLVVEERDGAHFARVPADGDALDRIAALLGLPPLGGAEALLDALERPAQDEAPPALSLPLRVHPAKATALGWSAELYSLTVLIGNADLRREDSALVAREGKPAVAVCAEYDRPLTSLDPPSVAGWGLQNSRAHGVPMLRLAKGIFRAPLRLESTSRMAKAPAQRGEARERAGKFLAELGEAWQQRFGPVLEVAWPVYRHANGGPLLDAVVGRPLPEMELR